MVFRYWGDRYADAEPFAALVDRAAGGIATDRLVTAIRGRQWQATPFSGSLDELRDQLAAQHPIILLLEDHPRTYHYVVAVAVDAEAVTVHDPSWGPSRRIPRPDFMREWGGSAFWALLVLPRPDTPLDTDATADVAPPQQDRSPADASTTGTGECDELLRSAIAEIGQRGLDIADNLLTQVHNACPTFAAPVAELAGVKFAQRHWRDAATLAESATVLDASNTYAWDVLGSSRYMLDDLHGALAAWNRIGKPKVSSVSISGLTRTRYQLVAEAVPLKPNALLTLEHFRLAERRVEQLPDHSRTRVSFVPATDGYAVVEIAIAERGTIPRSLGGFTTVAANAAINREVTLNVPGTEGQGEIWSATWRWWEHRPRIGFDFAGPRVGALPGTWHVNAAWEAQTFATAPNAPRVRENAIHVGVMMTNWLNHAWRYELTAGADSWDRSRRDALFGVTIERRGIQDRAIGSATIEHWFPLFNSKSFSRALLTGSFRTSNEPLGWVYSTAAGVEAVTSSAPLSLWPGAGEGHARAPLLRAHPLLVNGVVTGPVFGREVSFATNELTYWSNALKLARIGIAAFADTAGARGRMARAAGEAFQLDAGIGARLRMPGGTLRVDYARGIRDGRDAVTFGFNWFE
jgi:hypothetical protein